MTDTTRADEARADGTGQGRVGRITHPRDVTQAGATGTAEDAAARRRILNRLRRARGQLDAVIDAVEDERTCRDVITQLAAVSSALDRAGFMIISSAMKGCVADADGVNREEGITTEELEKLFLSLS